MLQINTDVLKRILKIFFGIPLTLLSFYFIFSSILGSSKNLLPRLSHTNIPLLVIGLLFISSFFILKSVVWNMILTNLGHKVPFLRSFFLLQYGETKRYIPGNIFSFAARVQYYKEFQIPSRTIIKGLAIEAALLVFSSILVSIPSILYFSPILLHRFFFISTLIQNLYFLFALFVLLIVSSITFLHYKKIGLDTIFEICNQYVNSFFLFVLAWILFGIGNYIVAASIGLLPISLFLQFISFFILSWLIGYLSFITPMGLGVREAILSLGLSQTMPIYLAATVSVLLRIAFTISELFVFGISYILQRDAYLKRIFSSNKLANSFSLVFVAMVFYISYFTYVTFEKFRNFYTGRFDLGNMDQTVWNTMHGHIFQITNPDGINVMSRLGFHADFILIFLSPFYFIWSDPRMLLLIQTVVLASGAIFVYLLAKAVTENEKISLLLSCGYLLNPLVQRINVFDFHPVALAITFILASFYFLQTKRYVWSVVGIFLAVITKENVFLISFLYGLFLMYKKKTILGSVISATSMVLFFTLMKYAIPIAHGGPHFALNYLSQYGSSPLQISINIFLKPQITFPKLFTYTSLQYLFALFSSVGFISFLSPVYLLFALPDVLINLLSNNANLSNINYQYTSTIVPFVYVSMVYAVVFIRKKWKFISYKTIFYYLLFCIVASSWVYGILPGANHPSIEVFNNKRPHREQVMQIILKIPQSTTISATNNLGAALSHRDGIYVMPVGTSSAQVLLFLTDDTISGNSQEAKWARMFEQNPKYTTVHKLDNFLMLKRN